MIKGFEAKSVKPETIAKTALRAITVKKPKYVYNINRNKLLLLLNILPARLQTRIIGRILRTPKKSKKKLI